MGVGVDLSVEGREIVDKRFFTPAAAAVQATVEAGPAQDDREWVFHNGRKIGRERRAAGERETENGGSAESCGLTQAVRSDRPRRTHAFATPIERTKWRKDFANVGPH
jgi:hypothetical protein